MDFFVVPTVMFKVLFVFVILAHDRRRVVHINVPTSSLGGPPGSGWAFTVVVTGQDGFSPDQARDFTSTPIYAREQLRPGNRFAGPAVIEQMDATTLVPPGMTARVDAYLNLILEAAT